MNVKIVDFPATLIAVLEHHGDPGLLSESIKAFIEWRKSSGLSPVANKRTFGVAYHDPATTPSEEFHFDICGEIDKPVSGNACGIKTNHIPAGRCATVRHYGSTDRVSESIYPIFREWLPGSGEELRDFPLFFHYLTVGLDVPEYEQMTDIYLPLK